MFVTIPFDTGVEGLYNVLVVYVVDEAAGIVMPFAAYENVTATEAVDILLTVELFNSLSDEQIDTLAAKLVADYN